MSPSAICTRTRPASPAAPSEVARRDRRPASEQVADQEHQAAAEHGDRGAVEQQRRVQTPEPVDVLAARVRPGGGRERPADEQREAGGADPEPGEPRLAARAAAVAPTERERLEPDDDRRAEHDEREQEVRDDERRVQVRVDGDRAERRLRERADEGRRPPATASSAAARA